MPAVSVDVLALAQRLAGPRCAHLTAPHQRDYIRGLARTIEVAIADYVLGAPPDDREWPLARPREDHR
jgi:hypothetical protein